MRAPHQLSVAFRSRFGDGGVRSAQHKVILI